MCEVPACKRIDRHPLRRASAGQGPRVVMSRQPRPLGAGELGPDVHRDFGSASICPDVRKGGIGFVFSCGAGRDIGVSLWGKRGCVVFCVLRFGFVLRNRVVPGALGAAPLGDIRLRFEILDAGFSILYAFMMCRECGIGGSRFLSRVSLCSSRIVLCRLTMRSVRINSIGGWPREVGFALGLFGPELGPDVHRDFGSASICPDVRKGGIGFDWVCFFVCGGAGYWGKSLGHKRLRWFWG